MEFTHFDQAGNAVMVDVSPKEDTDRIAVASGVIAMSPECYRKVVSKDMKKGDVLSVARIAGIMGAKRCPELIPLCHHIALTHLSVDFELLDAQTSIKAICTAKTTGKTGVEMEALTGVQVSLLTIYDMCKAVDKTMEMNAIHLEEKDGGKSGRFIRQRN